MTASLNEALNQSRKHVQYIIARLDDYASEVEDIKLQQVLSTPNIAYPHDIVLHELGHHALEAFYSDYTPPGYIPRMEFEAQAWANQMKVNNEFVTNHQEKRFAIQLDAIQYKIDDACDENYSQIAVVLCEHVGPAIQQRFAHPLRID